MIILIILCVISYYLYSKYDNNFTKGLVGFIWGFAFSVLFYYIWAWALIATVPTAFGGVLYMLESLIVFIFKGVSFVFKRTYSSTGLADYSSRTPQEIKTNNPWNQ